MRQRRGVKSVLREGLGQGEVSKETGCISASFLLCPSASKRTRFLGRCAVIPGARLNWIGENPIRERQSNGYRSNSDGIRQFCGAQTICLFVPMEGVRRIPNTNARDV